MTSITNLFNAIQSIFGVHDAHNRDLLILFAFVLCTISFLRISGVARRVRANSGNKSNQDKERLQNLALRVDDLASKLSTEVTSHERQLQVLLTKVDLFEQQLKKFKTSGGNLIFEFDTGENLEDRMEYIEGLLLDLRGQQLPHGIELASVQPPELEVIDTELPLDTPSVPQVPMAEILRSPREQILKQLLQLSETYKTTTDYSFKAIEELLKAQGFNDSSSAQILTVLRAKLPQGAPLEPSAISEALRGSFVELLHAPKEKQKRARNEQQHPHVMLVAGMNGATRIEVSQGIAEQIAHGGAKPIVTTCERLDTERREQLVRWGRESEVPLVLGSRRSKPEALTCKAVHTAQDNHFDVLIVDTVSGIDENSQVIDELKSIGAMVNREQPDVPYDTIIVVDASKPASVLQKVRHLRDNVGVTGLCVTNLDTANAVATLVSIENEAGVPVRYLTFSSGQRTLHEFSPQELVDALLRA